MKKFFPLLTKKIEESEKILLMTHKNMDLDGFSASLCISNIVSKMHKECFIYLSDKQSNDCINKTFKKIKFENYEYHALYKKDLKDFSFDNTLLIVVDVNKNHLLENSDLLNKASEIVVIDHHIQDIDYIQDTALSYINPSMSSVAEIMVNYCKHSKFEPDSLLATILLCAIEIDTNYFNFKTTASTYESAAFLTKCGASTIIKQELLRESKDVYIERQMYIEQSYQISDEIILCNIEDKIVSSSYLAIVADNLLNFEGIEASFCIGRVEDNIVGISARSIGNIDVQKIMKKLGGGGHITDAATKIENKKIHECVEELTKVIKEG